MKIHPNFPGQRFHHALRTAAICVTVAASAMICGVANAQSSLLDQAIQSQATPPSLVRNGLFVRGNDSFQVVNTAGYRTAADVGKAERGSVAQVGLLGSCGSCGTSCGGSCGGYSSSSCGSCGTSCGGACGGGYRRSAFCNTGSDPCAPCTPYQYAIVEGLYMKRDGEKRFSLSPNFGMDGFDYEFGSRLTVGWVADCVHGFEFGYTGPFDWDMSGSIVDPGFGIGTFLQPGLPIAASDLSAFSNADFQRQTYSAEYWSVEANKTLMGWDVAKLLAGVRYLNYDEQYNYFSRNATEAGALRSVTENQLVGVQVGMDLLYPVMKHGYTDFRGRIGGFVNFADSDLRIANAGSTVLRNVDDDTEFASLIEIGSGFRYQVGEMLSLRVGVEVWYLSGVATAPDQFRTAIRPNTGRRIRSDDDVLFTGFSFGGELRY